MIKEMAVSLTKSTLYSIDSPLPKYLFNKFKIMLSMFLKIGFTVYLSSENRKIRNPADNSLTPLIFVTTSLVVEIYIGIKVKKLPWTSLKSVTIGHIMFGITLVIVYKRVDSVIIHSIQPSLIFLIFQILYTIRLKEHFMAKIKKICSPSVEPIESENHDLNSIGIFVGAGQNRRSISNVSQSVTSSSNFKVNTFVPPKKLNRSDTKYDLFGGVYVGPLDIEDNIKNRSNSNNSLDIFTVSKGY